MNKLSLVSLLCFAVAGASAVACSSDDDTSSPTAGAGGKAAAGASAGGKGGASPAGGGGTGGAIIEAGAGGEAGAPVVTTLYERLGGHAGIRMAVDSIVIEETKDPIIASYFSQQASKSHKPTVDDISECLTIQLSAAAEGPEVYPVKLDSGFQCRLMGPAHATLGIGSGTFDKFVGIAATELVALGVSADDVASVGAVLNSTKSAVVDKNAPSGAEACKTPATCALPVEGEAGAGGATSEGGAAGATP